MCLNSITYGVILLPQPSLLSLSPPQSSTLCPQPLSPPHSMPLTSSILPTNPRPTPASTISTSGNTCLSPGHSGLNHLLLRQRMPHPRTPLQPSPHSTPPVHTHLASSQPPSAAVVITPSATAPDNLLLSIAATSHKHILPLAATPLFSLSVHHQQLFSPNFS